MMTSNLIAAVVIEDSSSSSFFNEPPENLTLSYFDSTKDLIDEEDMEESEDDEDKDGDYYTDDYANRPWAKHHPYWKGFGAFRPPYRPNWPPYPAYHYPPQPFFQYHPAPYFQQSVGSLPVYNKSEWILHPVVNKNETIGLTSVKSNLTLQEQHVYPQYFHSPPIITHQLGYAAPTFFGESLHPKYDIHPSNMTYNNSMNLTGMWPYHRDAFQYTPPITPISLGPTYQPGQPIAPPYVPYSPHYHNFAPPPPFSPYHYGYPMPFFRRTFSTTPSPLTNKINVTELIKGIKSYRYEPLKVYICLKALKELDPVDALIVISKNHISPTTVCRTLWKMKVAPLHAYEQLNKWMDDLHYKSKIIELLKTVTLAPPINITTVRSNCTGAEYLLTESQESRLQSNFGNYTYRRVETRSTNAISSYAYKNITRNQTMVDYSFRLKINYPLMKVNFSKNYLSNNKFNSNIIYDINNGYEYKKHCNFSGLDKNVLNTTKFSGKMFDGKTITEDFWNFLQKAEKEAIKKLPNVTKNCQNYQPLNDSVIIQEIEKLELKKLSLHKKHRNKYQEIQDRIIRLREKITNVHKAPRDMIRQMMCSKAVFDDWLKKHPEAYEALVNRYSIRFKNSMFRDVKKMALKLTTKLSWSDKAMQRIYRERQRLYEEKVSQIKRGDGNLINKQPYQRKKIDIRTGRLNSQQLLDISESKRNRILEVDKGRQILPKKRIKRKKSLSIDYDDDNYIGSDEPNWNYVRPDRFYYDSPGSSGPSDEPDLNPGHEMDSADKPLFREAYYRTKQFVETGRMPDSVEGNSTEKQRKEELKEKRAEQGVQFIKTQEQLQEMRKRTKLRKKMSKRRRKLKRKLKKKKKRKS